MFWDAQGFLLIDYLRRGETITGNHYAQLIAKLRIAIKENRRGMLSRGVLLNQDNAPVHKSAVAMAAIKDAGFELVDHPPYFPDLAPSDFRLFPNLKKHLRGQRFGDNSEVIEAVNAYFEGLPKSFFLEGLTAL